MNSVAEKMKYCCHLPCEVEITNSLRAALVQFVGPGWTEKVTKSAVDNKWRTRFEIECDHATSRAFYGVIHGYYIGWCTAR